MRAGFASAGHPDYRSDIDGLRAVAVIAVLLFHAVPSKLSGGFVGVDVFFVISGYLISGILFNSLSSGSFSFREFYLRRVRRLFPSLILVLTAVVAAGWFLMLPGQYAAMGRHAAASAAFVENFVRWRETGYFDGDTGQLTLLHLWSLAIEEQFYVWWPVLLFLAYRFRARAGLLLAIAGVASFVWCVREAGSDPVAAFFSPASRAWELLVGGAWAYVSPRVRPMGAVAANALSIGGLVLIGVAATRLSSTSVFPGIAAAMPTLGALALIAAGPNALPNRWLLANPVMVGIGLISYPLYLWHWPMLAFARIVAGQEPPEDVIWTLLALSVLLAALSYLLVERPLRRRPLSAWGATALIAPMVAIGLAGLAVNRNEGLPGRASIAPYQDPEAWFTKVEAWPYAENDTCLARFPSADRRVKWWFCVMNRDATPTLFVMGNSFANHLYPGIAEHPAFRSQTVLQFGTCDPGMGLQFTSYVKGSPCFGEGRQRQEAFASRIIESSPSLKFAILSSSWPRFDVRGNAVDHFDATQIDGQYSSVPPDTAKTSYEAFMAGLERRVAYLVERGVQPILFLSTPELPYSPRTCYSGQPLRPGVNTCTVPKDVELERQARFRAGVDAIRQRHNRLLVFDPLSALCRGNICDMKGADGPLLRDKGHLSLAGSLLVGDAFATWARANAPGLLDQQ